MPSRAPGTGAVPEVDWERAVRKIEVKDSAGREHADEAFQESGALRVPGGKWRNLVETGSTALGHADMLDDSRRDYGVEEAVEEGKAQRVRDDEPLAVRSAPPLPLAKCREVVSPRFEARLREEVDRLAVPAARGEDAPRARPAQDRPGGPPRGGGRPPRRPRSPSRGRAARPSRAGSAGSNPRCGSPRFRSRIRDEPPRTGTRGRRGRRSNAPRRSPRYRRRLG